MKEITIRELQEQTYYGLSTISNDKHIKKDSEELMLQLHRASGREMKPPYIVCMRDFYQDAGEYQLFIGDTIMHKNLEKLIMLKGTYAIMEISCKWMQPWYTAVHEAKSYIYHKWMDNQSYTSCQKEYVLFTDKSTGKKPVLELYVKLEQKQ